MSNLRMPEINHVTLAGRLTRDPDLRYTPSGAAVCTFSVAVSRKFKTKDGETKEQVYFGNVEAWQKMAEWLGQELKKGRPVLVEGSLATDEYEGKDGAKKSRTKINAIRVQPLDWADKDGGQTQAPATRTESAKQKPVEEEGVCDDDLPF
ncbi:MAG: single-stranded DNA-binding protein [Candidatus Hydrogenedentes bacterium]|nr:single-stranded DNA-binding protein [Candidatus Hydrogenedentota bacterium]